MRGGVNFDYGDPLGCSEKEEKRRGKKAQEEEICQTFHSLFHSR